MDLISASASHASAITLRQEPDALTALPPDVLTHLSNFQATSDTALEWFDEPPESGVALSLMLSLLNRGVPPVDLQALDDSLIERLAECFENEPAAGSYVLATLPARIANRLPWESVLTVVERALSASAMRDLTRSLSRAGIEAPEVARHGSSWGRYFIGWRDQILEWAHTFRWLGSGHTGDARIKTMEPMELAASIRQVAPSLPDFSRGGVTGLALALLYGSFLGQSIAHIPGIPRDSLYFSSNVPLTPPGPSESGNADDTFYADDGGHETAASSAASVHGWPRLAIGNIGPAIYGVLSYLSAMPLNAFAGVANGLEHMTRSDPQRPPAAQALLSVVPPKFLVHRAAPRNEPPAPTEGFLGQSSALRQLNEVANSWRRRAAVHKELSRKVGRSLEFKAPPSEAELFNTTLASAPEFAGIRRDSLLFRRHRPMHGAQRLKEVTYWTLPVAAKKIRDGDLDIANPGDGTTFDVCIKTLPGAVNESPTLVNAKDFRSVVSRWIQACDARAKQTWRPRQALKDMANSTVTSALHMALSISDLTIAYRHGLAPRRALTLLSDTVGQTARTDSLQPRTSVYPLSMTISHQGREQDVTPAGTFVICERPHAGLTLLYTLGADITWRVYASPAALFDDIRRNEDNLRDTLFQRLPLELTGHGMARMSFVTLGDRTKSDPWRVANLFTRDVILADSPLPSADENTESRIHQYATWLTGSTPPRSEQALIDARRRLPTTGPLSPGQFTPISLDDIEGVHNIGVLRERLSGALPNADRIAYNFAKKVLTQVGMADPDPDVMYVRMDNSPKPISFTSAVLFKLHVPQASASGPLLRRTAEGSLRPETRQWSSHQPIPDAASLVQRLCEGPDFRTIADTYTEFWERSRDDVRNVIKSEFIAQIWMQRETRHLSIEQRNIAARLAGPIELHRLNIAHLKNSIPSPKVRREWLQVDGRNSTLMVVDTNNQSPVLLIAAYPEGPQVYGFPNRAGLNNWFNEQTSDNVARRRLASTFGPMTQGDEWLMRTTPDVRGRPIAVQADTFTLLTAAYEAQSPHGTWKQENAPSRGVIIEFMDALWKLDLAVGAASWLLPYARPASTVTSVIDLSFGLVGEAVALATDNKALHAQAWQCIVSAIGSQGIAAARLPGLSFLTRDAKFRYFVEEPPLDTEELIPGLHRTGERLYANIDRNTRAYLAFDDTVGHFRLAPLNDVSDAATSAPGPVMRLSPSGHWRVATADDLLRPALEDPMTAWRIDQGFLQRYDFWRARNDPIFEDACRIAQDAGSQVEVPAPAPVPIPAPAPAPAPVPGAVPALPAASAQTPAPAQNLRLLKLAFINPSLRDAEALGTLAGRISTAQNIADAAARISISRLPELARDAEAVFVPIAQRSRHYLSHLRTGLLRATAVAGYYGQPEAVIERFNVAALDIPAAAEVFMDDLSMLGTSVIPYIAEPLDAPTNVGIATLLEGAENASEVFELKAGTHSLVLGKHVAPTGIAQYFFVDPSVAIVRHSSREELIRLLGLHLNDMAPEYGILTNGNGAYLIQATELDIPLLGEMPLFRDVDSYVTVRRILDV